MLLLTTGLGNVGLTCERKFLRAAKPKKLFRVRPLSSLRRRCWPKTCKLMEQNRLLFGRIKMTESQMNRSHIEGASGVDDAALGSGVAGAAAQTFGTGTPEEFTGSTTWMFTLAILAGLLLVGFFTGFVTRGAATAAVPTAPIQEYIIAGRISDGSPDNSASSKHITIASNAADQFLSMNRGADDEWNAVIKLHATSPDQPDELSIIQILPDGQIEEIFRRPGTGQSKIATLAAENGGAYFAYSAANEIAIQQVSSAGRNLWSKSFPARIDSNSKPQIEETNDSLILFAQGELLDQRRIAVLDRNGTVAWERLFDAKIGSRLSTGSSGEIFLLSAADAETQFQLHALTPTGATAWSSSITLGNGERILGMAPTIDGGVIVVAKRDDTTKLLEYDVSGMQTKIVQLDSVMVDVEAVQMSATDAGDLILFGFSEKDPLSRTLHIVQMGSDGRLIGSVETALSATATLDFVQAGKMGEIVLAGSDRPDRYSATDVFITTLQMEMKPGQAPTERAVETLVAELPEDNLTESNLQTVAQRQPSETNRLSQAFTSATEPQRSASTAEVAPAQTLPTVAPQRATLTRFMPSTVQIRTTENLGQATQCRFTCIDFDNPASEFPIWRPVKLNAGVSPQSIDQLYTAVCEAAGGRPISNAQPDCTT